MENTSDLEKSTLRKKIVELEKRIEGLNKTIDNLSEKEIDSHIEFESLKVEKNELFGALSVLVMMYIKNKGNASDEFISCITPKSAHEMSPIERMRDKNWRAWDNARLALGEGKK